MKNIAMIIPAYNPNELMVDYVAQLVETGFSHIVIVDDGSKDKTLFDKVSQYSSVHIIHHDVNRGKGCALKTAFNYYMENLFDVCIGVVTADCDGQHGVADTKNIAEFLAENDGLVLGTWDFGKKSVPFRSKFGNRTTTVIFSLLYGKHINDTQTGLRAISNQYIPYFVNLPEQRFEYEINMLIVATKNQIPIIEFPIETIYIENNASSHFHVIKDSFKIYKVLLGYFLKFSCSGILSWVIDISLFALLTKVIFKDRFEVNTVVFLGTVIARVISAIFNYLTNKNMVFKNRDTISNTLAKYGILCVCQLLVSYGLVVLIFQKIYWDTTFIKIIVDLFLFFISYRIQQAWVFTERRKY